MVKINARVGELMVAEGAITCDTLLDTLRAQVKNGARLGEMLLHRGNINPLQLYQVLAQHQGRRFVDLRKEPCNHALVNPEFRDFYIQWGVIPWREEAGRLQVAVSDITPVLSHHLHQHYPNAEMIIATPGDIALSLHQAFHHQDVDFATEGLWREQPHYSARSLRLQWQDAVVLMGLTLLFAASLIWQGVFFPLFLGMHLFYLSTLVCKIMFFYKGLKVQEVKSAPPLNEDATLPLYSILVPLYREKTHTLTQLIKALEALDYPKHRLDILFILEQDDTETLMQLRLLQPPYYIRILSVPYAEPRTKPKACNYALRYVKGEYVTIYDAEDIPDPRQLRKVLAIFRRQAEQPVGCVQARLNYYNAEENLLTRMFALEYACWFNFMLPGLYRLGIPIPLGGTSNHFPVKLLREMHGWDAYNVTEDADLGLRLVQYGYRVELCNSVTLEEAPVRVRDWLKQRTRWIKGYIQTFLVHVQHVKPMVSHVGLKGFFGFVFFIGAPAVVFLSMPIMLVLSVMATQSDMGLPDWVGKLTLGSMMLGIISHSVMAWVAASRQEWRGMKKYAIVFPVYWLLHCAASLRAVWQLCTRPYYWDKTEHGMTSYPVKGNT